MTLGARLGTIEVERQDKLKSFFTDRIDIELGRLREELDRCGTRDRERIDSVIRFARQQDYGPRTRDRHYMAHAVRVARYLAIWMSKVDSAPIIAALLHNGIEKGITTEAGLAKDFGIWVSSAIRHLTVDRTLMAGERGRNEYYRCLSKAPVEVQAIKIFDKFDNLLSLCVNPDAAVRERYLSEAQQYVLPMAEISMPDFSSYFSALIDDDYRVGHLKVASSA